MAEQHRPGGSPFIDHTSVGHGGEEGKPSWYHYCVVSSPSRNSMSVCSRKCVFNRSNLNSRSEITKTYILDTRPRENSSLSISAMRVFLGIVKGHIWMESR